MYLGPFDSPLNISPLSLKLIRLPSLFLLICYFVVTRLRYCRSGVKHQTINQYFVVTLADPKGFEFQKIEKHVCLWFNVPLEIKMERKKSKTEEKKRKKWRF